MELKEFVAQTIQQIVDGVVTAQGQISAKEYNVCQMGQLQSIEFDVAVTVSEGVSGGAGAGIAIAGILKLGVDGQTESASESVSRVRFTIPVEFPDRRPPIGL